MVMMTSTHKERCDSWPGDFCGHLFKNSIVDHPQAGFSGWHEMIGSLFQLDNQYSQGSKMELPGHVWQLETMRSYFSAEAFPPVHVVGNVALKNQIMWWQGGTPMVMLLEMGLRPGRRKLLQVWCIQGTIMRVWGTRLMAWKG